MTFQEIVNDIIGRASLKSSDATSRVGVAVNKHYKAVTASVGIIDVARPTRVSGTATEGSAELTFDGIERIDRVVDTSSGSVRVLTPVDVDTLRKKDATTEDPTEFAVYKNGPDFVTILMDCLAQSEFTLYADGLGTAGTLSGSQEPAFPESYHSILIELVLADELLKKEKPAIAREHERKAEKLLSKLRRYVASQAAVDHQQGSEPSALAVGGSGGGGSAPSGGTSYTQTGTIIFDRPGTGVAPFAVAADNNGKVDNLNADLLDGIDSTAFALQADFASHHTRHESGGADEIKLDDLAAPEDNTDLNASTSAHGLLRKLSGVANEFLTGQGNWATVTAVAGADTQVQFNDGGALAGDSGLTFDKTTDALTVGGAVTQGGDHVLSADKLVRRNTSDGSDNGVIEVQGGGATGNARGGAVLVHGNEHANTGKVQLKPGNVSGGRVEIFRQDGTLSAYVDSNGTLQLAHGQVAFPASQNASSDANTLDDYEEGTWTPVIGGSGGTSGQSYSSQLGTYLKIGKLVIAEFNVTLTTKGTITNNVEIQGLPFTVSSAVALNHANSVRWSNLATTWVSIIALTQNGTATAVVQGATVAAVANSTTLATADIGNTTQFNGVIIYTASA